MTEECRRFEASLLELAYGELDETAAEELRAHAAGCKSCFKALEEIMLTRKMAAQLPMLVPSDEMDAPILAAAAKAASEMAGSDAKFSSRPVQTAHTLQKPPSFAERLRGILLAPALATAAVAMLVLVLSFFLWQRGPKREETLIGEPQSASEVAAKSAEAPAEAEPKALGYVGDEVAEAVAAQEEEPPESTSSRTRAAAGNLGTAGPKPTAQGGDKAVDEPSPFPAVAEQERESKKKSEPYPDVDKLDDLEGGFARKESAGAGGGAVPQAITPQPADPSGGLIESEERAEAESAPRDYNVDFQNGMAAYSRGDCDSAETYFKKVVDRRPETLETAYAMHHIARCEKRRGKFAAALPWYEKVLGRFPSYTGRPDALLEAAACHRRLGQIDWARRRLEELSRIPGWEARANEELDGLSE